MPNIKSAKKRVLLSREANVKNKMAKSALKTTLKKFDSAVVAGNREEATAAYKAAGKETLEGRDHARVIVGSILGALTYTALYLLKSYIKLRFTTADVDPVAIQATMLSKAASSLFNAAFAFVVAPIFFNVLRKPLRRLGLYSKD